MLDTSKFKNPEGQNLLDTGELSFSLMGHDFSVRQDGISEVNNSNINFEKATLEESVDIVNSHHKEELKQAHNMAESSLAISLPLDGKYKFPYNDSLYVQINPNKPPPAIALPKDSFEGDLLKADTLVEIPHAYIYDADDKVISFFRAPCILPKGMEVKFSST